MDPHFEQQRVARQLNLPGFGPAAQKALADARLLIVGVGGLGCPAAQQLAAAGVGSMVLADPDTVAVSNLHRQVLFGAGDVGELKVDVAARRLQDMQPGLKLTTLPRRLEARDLEELLAPPADNTSPRPAFDAVLDCTDTFASKYLIADACEAFGIPLVWGTVLQHGGQAALWHSNVHGETLGGRISTSDEGNINSSHIRGVGLRDLFPAPPRGEHLPDCATAGVLGVTTSIIGGLMATLTIGLLTGLEAPVGRVSVYEAFPPSLRSFTVPADPARPLVRDLSAYDPAHNSDLTEKQAQRAVERAVVKQALADAALVIDVREPTEAAAEPLPAALESRSVLLPSSQETADDVTTTLQGVNSAVVVCASGMRSARFIDRFATHVPETRLLNCPGGLPTLNELSAQGEFDD